MTWLEPYRRATVLVPSGPARDPACKLFAGDHPFVQHDSFVEYAMARIELARAVRDGVAQGVLVPHANLDGSLFARVCHGLTISRFTKPRIAAYYHARAGL